MMTIVQLNPTVLLNLKENGFHEVPGCTIRPKGTIGTNCLIGKSCHVLLEC